MVAWIGKGLISLCTAAGARVDRAIIAEAVRHANAKEGCPKFSTRGFRERNARDDRKSTQPHLDRDEP
jgi:hypothetical protein